ncbi:MAG: winged helix-turn-helix transcriptional regulator [Myxococcales bacterium]|nr:winged helix-turn-helix transcriptional regulator [Myxococcales bacterium]
MNTVAAKARGTKPRAVSDRLDATFAALADPTRRAILARLADGEATVAELGEPFALSQPAISKHLKVLERAGLVARGRDAQRRPRTLEAAPLKEAADYLATYRAYWEGSFAALDAVLGELVAKEARAKHPARARRARRDPSARTTHRKK